MVIVTSLGLWILSGCAQLSPAAATKLGGDASAAAQAIAENPALRSVAATAVAQNPSLQATATAMAQAGGAEPRPGAPASGGATGPAVASATPTPGLPADGGRIVVARVGAISDVLSLIGRVTGQQEVPLAFQGRGTVTGVFVRVGQAVKEGDLLMEIDSQQAVKDLAAAKARGELSQARFQQASQSVQLRRQAEVADAQDTLRRAQNDLDQVRAGATAGERRSAEASVVAAQTAYDSARAQLDVATYEPEPEQARATELQLADQRLTAARLALQKAQAAQQKVQAGPDPIAVRAAERTLADLNVAQQLAQASLDRLLLGPDAAELAKAAREVERARLNLDVANSGVEPGRNTSIALAKLNLDEALEREALLKQPAPPEVIAAEKNKVANAAYQVTLAQEALSLAKAGPDQLLLESAAATVTAAQSEVSDAEASRQRLREAPLPPNPVTLARAALDAAELTLQAAIERQGEILSRPTPRELTDAQSRLASAESALQRVQTDGSSALELLQLQSTRDEDQTAIDLAQQTLSGSRLVAPTSGIVAYMQAQAGDTADPGAPSVVLATGGDAIAIVPLLDKEAPRVAPGQLVSLQMGVGESADLTGSVAEVVASGPSEAKVARIRVNWGSVSPTFGDTAQVAITVARKEQALLVPIRAVRNAGQRRYVEYLDGTERRSSPVQVGISTSTEAEILSGVTEGQQILLPPPGAL